MDDIFSGLVLVFGLMLLVYVLDAAAARLAPVSARVRRFAAVVGLGTALAGSALAVFQWISDEPVEIAAIAIAAGGAVLAAVALLDRTPLRSLFPREADDGRFDVGLVMLLWLVIFQLSAYSSGGDSVGEVSAVAAALQTLAFLGAALASVGFLTRRGFRATLARLGLDRVRTRDIWIGTVAVIPMVLLGALSIVLVDWLEPGSSDRLADTVEQITGGDTSLGYALVIGVSAAIGEETLFRGAIQPKYGLLLTSLIFALLHVQYDFLLVVASLFPIGIVLGLERKYLGTVAPIITHMLYNTLAVLAG